eukprot:5693711-Prymnesium_polylepis.2
MPTTPLPCRSHLWHTQRTPPLRGSCRESAEHTKQLGPRGRALRSLREGREGWKKSIGWKKSAAGPVHSPSVELTGPVRLGRPPLFHQLRGTRALRLVGDPEREGLVLCEGLEPRLLLVTRRDKLLVLLQQVFGNGLRLLRTRSTRGVASGSRQGRERSNFQMLTPSSAFSTTDFLLSEVRAFPLVKLFLFDEAASLVVATLGTLSPAALAAPINRTTKWPTGSGRKEQAPPRAVQHACIHTSHETSAVPMPKCSECRK